MPDITIMATDLVVKAMQISSDQRIELVKTVLQDSALNDAQCKKV